MEAPCRFFGVQPDIGLGMLEISLILIMLEQNRGSRAGFECTGTRIELVGSFFILVKAVASFHHARCKRPH